MPFSFSFSNENAFSWCIGFVGYSTVSRQRSWCTDVAKLVIEEVMVDQSMVRGTRFLFPVPSFSPLFIHRLFPTAALLSYHHVRLLNLLTSNLPVPHSRTLIVSHHDHATVNTLDDTYHLPSLVPSFDPCTPPLFFCSILCTWRCVVSSSSAVPPQPYTGE